MKPLALLLMVMTGATIAKAQDSVSLPVNTFSFGLSAGHYHSDLGVMLSVTTPFFFNNRVAARVSSGFLWSDLYEAEKGSFAQYSGALTGLVFLITQQQRVRVYVEAGIATMFPNHTFSDKSAVPMLYGLSGFEFYARHPKKLRIIYFLEIGAIANTYKAEKLEGQPGYCNGIMGITGFRCQW